VFVTEIFLQTRAGRWLRALASLKLTLLILIALGGGIVLAYLSKSQATWVLVVPLLGFALNLCAAMLSNPAFRRSPPLLVFHLALIAIILLLALGRLTYFKGQLELADGERFEGQLVQEDSGPWHPRRLAAAAFRNDGFTIHYAKGVRRADTRNQVSWQGDDGQAQQAVIGDQVPLVRAGYRFYTSHNKGFAPAFVWQPTGGQAELGTVHLPPYPLNEFKQAAEWQPSGSRIPLWVMLQFDELILDPSQSSEFHPPAQHQVVVRAGEQRQALKPGDSMQLAEGVLTYQGLRSWMGYTVFYDFTLPWLLAAGLVAALSLARYFWHKFAARPWDQA
jgi:cytochrome c biogenesis protein ResB